jgi:hypothetical protein
MKIQSEPCLIWKRLSTDECYRTGKKTERLGGNSKKTPFNFRFEDNKLIITVPGTVFAASGSSGPIHVNECEFATVCLRYFSICHRYSISPAKLGRPYASQFTNPKWKKPVLGQLATPYVAAVIRQVIRDISLSSTSCAHCAWGRRTPAN